MWGMATSAFVIDGNTGTLAILGNVLTEHVKITYVYNFVIL